MAFNYDIGSGVTTITAAPAASAPQEQLGSGGVVGGGPSRNIAPVQYTGPSESDRTLDAVLEIGQGILGTKLKEQQNKAFLTGVQRAMTGEALKDIVDEQPWFTQIFGQSSTAQGARAYTQIAQVDKYTADLYGDMDRLQKMTPDEVGKEVTGRMGNFLTGDDQTDTAIQMKMVESAGPFFKAHAKQHYKWQQTDMQTQVTNAMMQSGDMVQAAARSWMEGTANEQDRAQALSGALSSFQPLAGQSATSYWEAVKSATITSMAKGNHYIVQALFSDHDGQGSVFSHAPAEIQLDILNARETYEARTKAKEGTLEFGEEMGRIQGLMATGQMSPQQGIAAMENVNTKFRLKTGIDGDVYDKKDVAHFIQSDYSAYYKAQQAATKANAENTKAAQTLNEQVASSRTAFVAGNAGAAVDSGIPKQVVDNTVLGAMQELAANGKNPYPFLIRNYNGTGGGGGSYVNEPMRNNMMAGILASSSGYTPAFDQSVAQYNELTALPEGKNTAIGYFGKENVVKLENYKFHVAGGMLPDVAWQASFGSPMNKLKTTPQAKMEKEIIAIAKSDQPGMIMSAFTGQTPLTKNNVGVLASAMAEEFDVLRQQLSVNETEAQAQALASAKNKVDIVGPYAYKRSSPDQKPLNVLIGAAPDAAGRAFSDFFAQKAKAQGFELPAGNPQQNEPKTKYKNLFGGNSSGPTPWNKAEKTSTWEQWDKDSTDSVTLIRGQDVIDANGKTTAKFILMGTTKDGKIVQMGATADEIRKFYEQQPYFTE